jgi:hypothetical protein
VICETLFDSEATEDEIGLSVTHGKKWSLKRERKREREEDRDQE